MQFIDFLLSLPSGVQILLAITTAVWVWGGVLTVIALNRD